MADLLTKVYIGIDIDEKYTMVSFFRNGMTEPETLSPVIGSEHYRIRTALSKRKGMGQWYFGDEAKESEDSGLSYEVPNLYENAKQNKRITIEGEIYSARDLFLIFIKKILSMPGRTFLNLPIERLTFTVSSVKKEEIDLFLYIGEALLLEKDRVNIIDRKESFYYYALSMDESLYLKDVILFDHDGKELSSVYLTRNLNTTPQVIDLLRTKYGELSENKDRDFLRIIENTVSGKAVSSVYLIGEGFDGDWMKESLLYLCKNRRVFQGKNLYSKGACYFGYVKSEREDWPFVFIGDNELKMNLSLKVSDNNEMKFITLLNAGESWFYEKGECEVILDGEPEISVFVQKPDSREAKTKILSLSGIEKRKERTTRLRISAEPKSDKEVLLMIKDLGFGEIVPSSGKIWVHRISI